MGWLASGDPELKRAVNRQRRRKLAVRAGVLRLVESGHDAQARWAAITFPQNAPIPISAEVAEGLQNQMFEIEERLYEHLAAVPSTEPLVLAGQIVSLMCASEFLLGLFPSNKVAAFCVQLASASE